MNDETIFPETGRAADLLKQFYELSTARRKTHSPAVESFYNKDVLTISEFLAPIGEWLTRPDATTTRSIGEFLSASLGRRSSTSAGETIFMFLSRL